MTVRRFEEGDKSEVGSWWMGHKWEAVPLELTSDLGFVVPGVCAAWLYVSNSPIAFIGWPVGNPDKPPKEVYEGLSELVEHMTRKAKELGSTLLFSYAKHDGLLELFKKKGFAVGDDEMTNMILGL